MQGKKKTALNLAAGHASLTGPRERNEDYCGIAQPEGLELENKGAIAAVAAAAEVLHIQPKGRIGAGAGLLGKTFGLTNLACRLCQLGCRSLGLSQ